jgi:hypothetical protein
MWNWFNCYLSGRHDYTVSCDQGAIFLRCPHCGRRSTGWSLHARAPTSSPRAETAPAIEVVKMRPSGLQHSPQPGRVLPFGRTAS